MDADCKAHVYKQHRLQVAYIQEYFDVRANVVKAELCQLQQLSGSSDAAVLPRGDGQIIPWQIFFSHIWRLAKQSKRVFAYPMAQRYCFLGLRHHVASCRIGLV